MMALAALVPMILWVVCVVGAVAAAAISSEPAGVEVERRSPRCCSCWALGEAAAAAPLPKRAHAFFHLHWVHQRSRCSSPYTLRHFLPSRTRRVGLLMMAAAAACCCAAAGDGADELG